MEIWLNPACSKCAAATEALDGAGVSYTVRRYLDDPPTVEELAEVLAKLNLEPWHIVRFGEPIAAELGLDGPAAPPRDAANREKWLALMAANPILIQRPIITADDSTAVIGRTPEALSEAIDKAGRTK